VVDLSASPEPQAESAVAAHEHIADEHTGHEHTPSDPTVEA
jgi:hypothetical protein